MKREGWVFEWLKTYFIVDVFLVFFFSISKPLCVRSLCWMMRVIENVLQWQSPVDDV